MLKPAPTKGDTAWFVHDRFGMFIHWGLYALPARHEWVKNYERITDEDYQKYFHFFDPDLYDPQAWARAAREAGMKYFVITAKHHEGFCLWDSQFTDYKVTNTPYGKDLLTPLVEAMRSEGLRVGFYYSLIDWHHPDFTIDGVHPMRDHPDALKLNQG
ncbi:MAG TPA: alpha-L-fucosidase, partial [Abditibacteriaceae bacterium]